MPPAQLTDVVRRIRRAAGRGADERPDADLLEAFRTRREEEAFAVIVARYGGLVLGACRRVLDNSHDAEDACQATFLVLARQAGRIRQSQTLPGWLYGTAHRVALQARRADSRRRRREEGVRHGEPSPDPAAELMWRELQAVLDDEVGRLPPPQRSAFLLCCMEGVSHAEAGKRLGVAEGSVSSRVTRARQRLHGRLRWRGIDLGAVLAVLAVGSVARAALPTATQGTLVRAALAWAAGPSGAVPALSVNVLNLAAGVSPTMWSTPTKLVVLGLVAAGILGGAARLVPGRPVAHAAAAQPLAAAGDKMPAKEAAGRQGRPASRDVRVTGRVLGPDGRPAVGAHLYVPTLKKANPTSLQDIAVESIGKAAEDGSFSVSVRTHGGQMRSYLIAHAPGLGVDWLELADGKPADVTLRLVRDLPIRGRVVNTEGKPVPGVSVSVSTVYVPADDKLDGYLAGWLQKLRDTLATPNKRLYVPLDDIVGPVKTDGEGRFTLRGAGVERIVHVTFEGGGIARSTPYVITREGFDPAPYNRELLKKEHDDLRLLNRFLGLCGPQLTFVAEPGKTVQGVVCDAGTGKAVPGCGVGAHTGFGDGVQVSTDVTGRFRLEGLPKNAKGYDVFISPPKGRGYLTRTAHAADTEGYVPVKLDVTLARGVVVTGRVVDRQTGKGVEAGIRFAPLPDNKFFGSKPGFGNYASDRTMEETDKEGRFRLTTIPGRALVMAQVHSGEKFHGQHLCPYRMAIPDPDHKELFKPEDDRESWIVTTAGGLEFLSSESAVKVIDIKEEGETRVELFVDRGVTGRVEVQDADGRPLPGAWVSGLTQHWPITYKLPEAGATVYALDAARPRTLVVLHVEKSLGGTATIRGDEKGPVVVKLGPLGKVSGRFLEEDGTPLAGAEVSVNAQDEIGRELYRFATPTRKPARTDKDGRFTLDGIVPGLPIYLQTHRGEQYYAGKPRIGLLKLKAGEARHLGDRKLEVAQ
jgi:RNA polymerase sigma factor (sigma-70 family)